MEFLTDGVFAIVMTLLVLEIDPPEGPVAELGAQLRDTLPQVGTFALVLVTLGVLWVGNRTQSQEFVVADRAMVWFTILLVGIVSFVPFSARLLGEFPGARIAVVLFGLHLTLAMSVHGSLWAWATAHPGLLREDISAEYRRRSRWWAFFPAFGYAAATLLGLAWPPLGWIGFGLVLVPMVGGIYYGGLARLYARTHPVES